MNNTLEDSPLVASYDKNLIELCKIYDDKWTKNSKRGIQQCYEELYYLKRFIGNRKFKRMLEIGVDDGGTAWLYANLFGESNSVYYACDIEIKPHIEDIAHETKIRSNVNIIPVQTSSQDFELIGFDFVHIDGDHQYEAAAADFIKFWPRIKKGGICLLHDTCLWPGTIQLRNEIEQYYDCITIKGHSLLSGDFGVPNPFEYELGTGITIVFKNEY